MTDRRVVLIDGDILLYRALTTSEKEVQFAPGEWFLWSDHNEALHTFDVEVEKIKKAADADGAVMALTDYENPNFRKTLNSGYKSNRKDSRKPMAFQAFRKRLADEYKTLTLPTCEADDVLGIAATTASLPYTPIIASDDKDLLQIPGLHMKLSGDLSITQVTPEAGYRHFLFQTLTGDAVDGYRGCPGVGPVAANKRLDEDCSWESVVAAYEWAGQTAEDALMMARMARILQHEDYDLTKKEVRLWQPDSK